MIVALISALAFVSTAYIFTIEWKMEIVGLAYAFTLQAATQVLLIIIYSYCLLPQIKEAIIWPTKEVLNGVIEYLRLAIPTVIFYAAFWFCYEIYVLVAGNLSPANQACTSIALSIIVILKPI